jgi:ethanolamine ammonia-lyase large subunit
VLFGSAAEQSSTKGIIHLIGERPGTAHRNFSAYITAAPRETWARKGKVDHDITRVVSGISDTAYEPKKAALEVATIFEGLFRNAATSLS